MSWGHGRTGDRPVAPTRVRLWRDDGWLAIAAPALVFLGHVLYGAMLPQVALTLEIAAALMLGLCLARPGPRKDLLRLDGLALPAVLFTAVILVALWSLTPFTPGGPHPVWAFLKISPGAATIDKSATLLEIIKLMGLGCLFLLGAATGGADGRARLAVNTMLTLSALLAAWSFFTFVTGNQSGGNDRLEASFQSANTAATVFAVSLALALGPAVSRLKSVGRGRLTGATVYGVAALLFLICIFATASRGGFIAAGAGLLAFGLLLAFGGRLRWSRVALSAAGVAIAVFALLAVSGQFLLDRLVGSGHEFSSRAYIFQVHWQAFLGSPLFGYGLGTFDTINRMLLDAESFPKIWTVRAAHNLYLGWLEQGGVLAAVPMFACVGVLVVTTLRKGLRRSRMTSFIFALIAVDAVYAAHGATDFALEMFSVAAMWAYLLGLQFSLAQGSSAR